MSIVDWVSQDTGLLIQTGHDPSWTTNIKFGHNPNSGTSWEPIWHASTNFTPLQAAQPLDIVSSSAQDAVGGTGASQVQVQYVDSDGMHQDVTVTMTGTTPVTGFATGFAVNRMFVSGDYGSAETNVGNITVTEQGSGTIQGYIAAEDGQTQQAIFRVPANMTAYLDGYTMSADSSRSVDFRGIFRLGIGDTYGALGPRRVGAEHNGLSGIGVVKTTLYREYPPGSLLLFEAQASVAGAECSGTFDVILRKMW